MLSFILDLSDQICALVLHGLACYCFLFDEMLYDILYDILLYVLFVKSFP